MRKTMMALAIVILAVAPVVMAQKEDIHLNGTAGVGVSQNSGNNTIGGDAEGKATGTYKVDGGRQGHGHAGANGAANSVTNTGSNSFNVQSGNAIHSDAGSVGRYNTNTVKGSADQGTWGSLGNDQNGVMGADTSTAKYHGKIVAVNDPGASGNAKTTGALQATMSQTQNSNSTSAKENSSSAANIGFYGCDGKPSGKAKISGEGALGAISTMGSVTGPIYGGAVAQGMSSYTAKGNNLSGMQTGQATTSVKTTSTGVTASSSMQGTSQVTGSKH